jgi:hypothetical protein
MAVASPALPPDHYTTLRVTIDSYIKYSRLWMRVWATIYYGLRISLIVLSAAVATKGVTPFLDDNGRTLSLIVAIGTSLDTWLKTGNRYKGHYVFNDRFIALCTDLELADPNNNDAMAEVKAQFKKLVEDYSTAVLPT